MDEPQSSEEDVRFGIKRRRTGAVAAGPLDCQEGAVVAAGPALASA